MSGGPHYMVKNMVEKAIVFHNYCLENSKDLLNLANNSNKYRGAYKKRPL